MNKILSGVGSNIPASPGKSLELKLNIPILKALPSMQVSTRENTIPKRTLGSAVRDELDRSVTERILIIDDNDEFRAMVRKMLENAGYTDIEETGKGIVGIKLFKQHLFDLVITDIIMPDKEGLEIITELTRDYPRIKIIAVSGGGKMGPQSYLEMAEMLGASRILMKPFKQSDLIVAVKELLSE